MPVNSQTCAGENPAQLHPPTGSLQRLLDQHRVFLRFLERRVPSPALAEDILQNAYLRALESAGSLHNQESATAWFYRILRNAVIDFYRRRTVEDRALALWASEVENQVAPDPLTHTIVCQCIARILPALKPSYAQILSEIDLQESSLSTFSARHSISPSNAAVRLHRARKALKAQLIATCGCCLKHLCADCDCRASR